MREDQIVYKIVDTPLGDMVAGATTKGCCLLEFEDRGGLERIEKRILKRYGLEMVPGENQFVDQLESELEEYFKGNRQMFSVPLDLKGTPFQISVWEQLLEIPYGETRSYGDVAKAVGNPQAVRAVGRANGDNYIGIVIPCHRVIEANGKLRGYGGGLWRKRKLLDLESGVMPL